MPGVNHIALIIFHPGVLCTFAVCVQMLDSIINKGRDLPEAHNTAVSRGFCFVLFVLFVCFWFYVVFAFWFVLFCVVVFFAKHGQRYSRRDFLESCL
jgi:hypothetical protein